MMRGLAHVSTVHPVAHLWLHTETRSGWNPGHPPDIDTITARVKCQVLKYIHFVVRNCKAVSAPYAFLRKNCGMMGGMTGIITIMDGGIGERIENSYIIIR